MSPKTPTRRSPPVLLLSMVTGQMFTTGSEEWGIGIADCGFMNLFNPEREIKIESCRNPQSAIRNPQSEPAHARTASITQMGNVVRITRVSLNPDAARSEL